MNWKSLKDNAYVPYSEQPEVCAVKGKSGSWYPGVRIENISYPLTIHAEQSAVCQCLSNADTPLELHLPDEPLPENRTVFWEKEFDMTIVRDSSATPEPWYSPFISVESNEKQVLKELLDYAVTPNSDFQVSCLLKLSDGRYIPGVNIEFSDWQTGLCAERVALSKALAFGFTNFEQLMVHARRGEYVSPCGTCRQVILEHMPDHPVSMLHGNETTSTLYSSHLLPYSFTADINES